jgi:uncharacterized membrane protein YecN with MAPEG domain
MRTRKRKNKESVSENQLNKAIRAHGNASEYIPLFIVLFLYFSISGASIWVLIYAYSRWALYFLSKVYNFKYINYRL